MSVPEKLQTMFSKLYWGTRAKVDLLPDMMFEDIDIDDLDRQELAMMIEDEFSVTISDETAYGWTSVSDLITLLAKLEQGA